MRAGDQDQGDPWCDRRPDWVQNSECARSVFISSRSVGISAGHSSRYEEARSGLVTSIRVWPGGDYLATTLNLADCRRVQARQEPANHVHAIDGDDDGPAWRRALSRSHALLVAGRVGRAPIKQGR